MNDLIALIIAKSMFESSFSSIYKENIELDANFDTSEILNTPLRKKLALKGMNQGLTKSMHFFPFNI